MTSRDPGRPSPPIPLPPDMVPRPNELVRAPLFRRTLDTVGDGSGTVDAIGDLTAGASFLLAPTRFTIAITRLIVVIRYDGQEEADGYGSIPALTNGITLTYIDQHRAEWLFTDQQPIRTFSDWADLVDTGGRASFGTASDKNQARGVVNFLSYGSVYRIAEGERFEVRVADNFDPEGNTAITRHRFTAVGYLLS